MLKKRILIFANETCGFLTVKKLIELNYNICAIFTSHKCRKQKIADYKSFDELSLEYPEIPIHYIDKVNQRYIIEKIFKYNPFLILVISWSQIIPSEIINTPTGGTIGVHYSMLPKRRGGAPLSWAIIDGLKETGLTLFYYEDSIDSGDIIDRIKLKINFGDDIHDVLKKIYVLLPDLICKNLNKILNGTNERIKQDHSKATYTRPRKPEDGEIDWNMNTLDIYNFIRAQTYPYPYSFSKIVDSKGQSKKLLIKKGELKNNELIIHGVVTDYE